MSVDWIFVYIVLSTNFMIALSQCYPNGRCICHCDCESGCTSCYKGWSGSKDNVCQRKNVAYKLPIEQKESKAPAAPTIENVQYAVDENITSFSKSEIGETPLLLLKFQDIKRIKFLHIISSAESGSGMQTQADVYVTNSTERNVTWCGRIQPTLETSGHNLNCTDTLIGSLIFVYLDISGGPLLINEMKVYECSLGTYGYLCEKICRNCISNQCDDITGVCLLGCRNGWYGDLCDIKCASACVESCDRTSGLCYKCIPGRYGPYCSKPCSRNCNPAGICHQNGVCRNGCLEGWSGAMCDKKCFDRKCSNCTLSTLCEQCQDGKRECQRCRSNCSSCEDDLENCLKCDNEFGNCTKCIKGRYGTKCNMKCSDHCIGKDCEFDGLCTLGCKEGFAGETCTKRIKTNVTESFTTPYVIAVSILGVLSTSFAVLLIRFKVKQKRKKEREMQVTYESSRVTLQEAGHGYATVNNMQHADQDYECVREPDYQTIDFCTV